MAENEEKCQRCESDEPDLRTLWMACFYEMNELGLPFEQLTLDVKNDTSRSFYLLRVCKSCRSDWMKAIKEWFKGFQPAGLGSSTGTGVFVRDFGATVELTEAQVKERFTDKGIEPHRVKS